MVVKYASKKKVKLIGDIQNVRDAARIALYNQIHASLGCPARFQMIPLNRSHASKWRD